MELRDTNVVLELLNMDNQVGDCLDHGNQEEWTRIIERKGW